MKKTFFIRTIQTIFKGAIFSLIAFSLYWLGHLLIKLIPNTENPTINNLVTAVTEFLEKINTVLLYLGFISLTFIVLLILIEIYLRLRRDSLRALCSSIISTIQIRRFLTRQNDHNGDSSLKIKAFNRAIKKTVIDVRNDSVELYIRLPLDAQVQEAINSLQDILKEEITNCFPDFIFSNFERKHHTLWLVGTNRSV